MDEIKEARKQDIYQQLLKLQQLLNRVDDSPAIETLIELRAASSSILFTYPHQFSLSHNLSNLADSLQDLHNANHGLKSFLIRRVKSHEITQLSNSVASELHRLIDRETVASLTKLVSNFRYSLLKTSPLSYEHQLFDKMSVLQDRLSRGFDRDLQHTLLKSGLFGELQWVLCNLLFSTRIREKAALLTKELVLFNKNVFVGSVLVGGTVKALVLMGSLCSLQVLSCLIKAIRSPLVDEIESCGGVLKIIDYLSSNDLEMRTTAMNCLLEIGYYGRKKAVEAMINSGLIIKLVELQRMEIQGNKSLFGSCVARFAVQLEVGEGLRQREKRAFKLQILGRVREACVSNEAESATIVAEVLWGSSP